jgi:hypothetical protein
MFNKTTPLIKRFKTKTITASGTATKINPVELGEQRIQLHIQPLANHCTLTFNEGDANGLHIAKEGIYIIEGYQGPLFITGTGVVIIYEGVI